MTSLTKIHHMMKYGMRQLLKGLLGALLAGMSLAHAAEPAMGFIGKNDWLFYRVEFSDPTDQPAVDQSINLIRRFNKVLSQNDITLAFVMVPLKMRIYSEYLPDNVKISPYMQGNYERMAQALRTSNVNVIDLNEAFLNSPQRDSEMPFFFRLDTHWSPAGAMLAAETIRAQIDLNLSLKQVLEAIPEEKFMLLKGKRIDALPRGLIGLLPVGSPTFGQEQVQPFSVRKRKASSLFGDDSPVGITLMGSSYSAPWYLLPSALRYTLQRNVLPISVEAIQGSWVGMESYLRDDSFQTQKPKLLIWEVPERDMRMPPNYKYRESRYHIDNTEWLLRASAWVQNSCLPSKTMVKVVASSKVAENTGNFVLGETSDQDFIELSFDKTFQNLDYLVASIATEGSRSLLFEASGKDELPLRFRVPVAGDGKPHLLKTPLISKKTGYSKLRIFPGKSFAFVLKDLQVCSQPEGLLK